MPSIDSRWCRIPVPIGMRVIFTFLSSTHANKQHKLVISPSVGTGAELNEPPDLNIPVQPVTLGPWNTPMLVRACVESTPDPPISTNPATWAESFTQLEAVSDSPQQWIIGGDDTDQNGDYLDMVVSLVIQ